MVNGQNLNNFPYNTLNVPLNTATFAVDNPFNAELRQYVLRNGTFVDFSGHLAENSHCIALKNYGIQNGKSPRCDIKIAQNVQRELNTMGISLHRDFYKKHIDILVACYVICGMGYCSVRTKDKESANSFLCTKNISTIRLLCQRYNIPFPHKAVAKYQDRFYITETEINENYLNAVKIAFTKDGLKLSSCRIYPHSKSTTLVPMFVMGNFNDAFVGLLNRGVYEIRYRVGSVIEKVVTSLNTGAITKYTRLDPQYLMNSVYSQSDLGVLRIYDFNQGEFVHVRLIDLVSVKKVR